MSGHPACQYGRYQPPRTPKHLDKKYKCDEREDRKEENRKKIVKLLDKWVDSIERECDLKNKGNPDVCSGCFPEFTCLAPYAHKMPFCLHKIESPLITHIPVLETRLTATKKNLQSDADTHIAMVYVKDVHDAIPVWERPRIKSQRLIGGEYKKLTECFKKNGMATNHWCPRTPSCQLIKSMDEWIEVDRKQYESNPPSLKECCCCADRKSTLPGFRCGPCDPPKTYQKHITPTTSYTGASRQGRYKMYGSRPMCPQEMRTLNEVMPDCGRC